MTQEDSPLSDLESLLSIDNITENHLLQLPELLPEEPKNSHSYPPAPTHEPEALTITPTDKPTIALNDGTRKRKPTIPSRQLFQKQKGSEEAALKFNFSEHPKSQFNLTYKIKEIINQWRILFWDPKRQKFSLENPSLNFQRLSVPLRSFSAF